MKSIKKTKLLSRTGDKKDSIKETTAGVPFVVATLYLE
jgi:hypothetical protein